MATITQPRSIQIRDDSIESDDIKDGGVYRQDLCTSQTGFAVIRKLIAGTNVTLQSTGADPGTGDVTVNVPNASGLSEAEHELLDTLTHELAEDCWTEIVRASGYVSEVIVWTSNGKTKKIREYLVARSAGRVSSITVKNYDSMGVLVTTISYVVTRQDGLVVSITATRVNA